MVSMLCFVCSRCEIPICDREDLILTKVSGGTTDNAFEYALEDILSIETSVPCYSGDEVTEIDIRVSDKILAAPLPPAARQLALDAVRTFRSLSDEGHEETGITYSSPCNRQNVGSGFLDTQSRNNNTNENISSSNLDDSRDETVVRTDTPNDSHSIESESATSHNETRREVIEALSRFGYVQESRVDLVCVKANVLGSSLAQCTKDRKADVSAAQLMQIPPMVMEAVRRSPQPTRWYAHPGNLVVEEGFIQVRRRTKTARYPWFEDYDCRGRLECPECHLGLGYLFVRKPKANKVFENIINGDKKEKGTEITDNANSDVEINGEDEYELHQKKKRKEDEGWCASSEVKEQHQQQKEQNQESNNNCNINDTLASNFPETFIGLELKKIRQREWNIHAFLRRYQQAKDLNTFRELFPEAEELSSLHSRLTAFRMQSELYSNLLQKHKEQNDVQSALLQSQKERIYTYEEKLRTMQQIIEAQRAQLEMQTRQIKYQEELLRNHKNQVVTQQQQIQVEQLLLSEQSRTIESQRDQLTLIQSHLRAHLRVQLMKDHLDERCKHLTQLLERAWEQKQETNASPCFSATTSSQRTQQNILPPVHLLGITGQSPTTTDAEEQRELRHDIRKVNSVRGQTNRRNVSQSLSQESDNSSGSEGRRSDVGYSVASTQQATLPTASTETSEAGRRSLSKTTEFSERTMSIIRRLASERGRRHALLNAPLPGSILPNKTGQNGGSSS